MDRTLDPPLSLARRILAPLAWLLVTIGCASAPPLRNAPADLGLAGFDPVSYFPEGGGRPRRGQPDLEAVHEGVTYRFASEANRKLFLADPAAHAPAYGGWCAWAMVEGQRVEVDPRSYLLQEGRLLLFYDGVFGDTRALWLAGDGRELARRADGEWQELLGGSGE